jgi:hydrogenase maturation protease
MKCAAREGIHLAKTLIVGYGNPLRSDDAFGQHAAHHLSSHIDNSNVEVLTRHQLTPDLAEVASHFELVIFIDAAADLSPGELRCERITRSQQAPSFSHSLTPAALLACTAELYAKFPEAYCISIGGESFAEGESLSPIVRAAFDRVLETLQSLIPKQPPPISRV